VNRFARMGAPAVAVVRRPALRASPRTRADPRTSTRRSAPLLARQGAPAVAVVRRPALRASPRTHADPRNSTRRSAPLLARQGAPAVAVVRRPALRASPRAGPDPRRWSCRQRRHAKTPSKTRHEIIRGWRYRGIEPVHDQTRSRHASDPYCGRPVFIPSRHHAHPARHHARHDRAVRLAHRRSAVGLPAKPGGAPRLRLVRPRGRTSSASRRSAQCPCFLPPPA
jgi:hypothetical protein